MKKARIKDFGKKIYLISVQGSMMIVLIEMGMNLVSRPDQKEDKSMMLKSLKCKNRSISETMTIS